MTDSQIRNLKYTTAVKVFTDIKRLFDLYLDEMDRFREWEGNKVEHEGNIIGIPWLLCEESVEEFQYSFLKYSHYVIDTMLNMTPILANFVDSRHSQAIKYLKWLGFTVVKEDTWKFNDVVFYHFWMNRGVSNV